MQTRVPPTGTPAAAVRSSRLVVGKAGRSRSIGFLLAYALANAGGVLGYLPLLSMLLPLKVEAMAGEERLSLFTACMVTGGIAASVSNILFGWLSDRSVARGGGRRPWVVGGLAATGLSFAGIAVAATPLGILVAVAGFQVAVNAGLAPLTAIMADEIPDGQKGVAGGLLSLGFPLAAALSAVLMSTATLGERGRLLVVLLAMTACLAPLLLAGARRVEIAAPIPAQKRGMRRDLAVAWGARILVQVANNVLSTYLLFYFESLGSEPHPVVAARVGHVLTLGYLVPVPIALLVGRGSDRIGRRKPFLLISAAVAAAGLIAMALSTNEAAGAIAFVCYSAGSGSFLVLHSAFTMQLLPSPDRRGRDLGLLNLTNTLPALLGPVLTWQLATPASFDHALLVLAGLASLGMLLVLPIRGLR